MGAHHIPDPRTTTPVDPWATMDETLIMPTAVVPVGPGDIPRGGRPIFGRVYELFLVGQPAGTHTYVGQTEQTMSERIRGHRSARDVARYPWKANLAPGTKAYRVLETVRETGHGARADLAALKRAEAFWIDRLQPTENRTAPAGRVPSATPVPRPEMSRPVGPRRPWGRIVLFVLLAAIVTTLTARVVVAMELPWPWAPWAAAPTVGVLVAWRVLWMLRHAGRQLAGLEPAPRPKSRRRAPARRRRR